ncbi:MAG: hypothetical protein ABJA94_10435, partial [Rhodoglobus sp.]
GQWLRTRRIAVALSCAAFLLALAAEIFRVLRVIADGADSVHVLEVAAGTVAVTILGILVLIAVAKHRNARRLVALRVLLPDAFVGDIFAGAGLLDAVASMRAEGEIEGRLPLNTLVGITAAPAGVNFYDGGAQPRLLLSISRAIVIDASPGQCETVRGTYPCVNLTVRSSGAQRDLPLLLSRTTMFGAQFKAGRDATRFAAQMAKSWVS